ncbi:MAG: phage tail assembly chaperone [Sphingobium sp.]|uniref:phage tail assembly chaperone n=1 Tax=Sphingobium sp. TaxID=1912891 RepID=UPI002E1A181A
MTGFADAAVRLAGVAGWLLGWRPEEFWRATPAELAAVLGAAGGEGEAEAGAGVDGAELRRLMGVMPD